MVKKYSLKMELISFKIYILYTTYHAELHMVIPQRN